MGRERGTDGTSTLKAGATVTGGGGNGGVPPTCRSGAASVGGGIVAAGKLGWVRPVRIVVSFWRAAT